MKGGFSDKFLVTVGITTRNRPEHLQKALASVFEQTLRPLEVLIIDDSSEPPLVPVAAPPDIVLKWWRYEKNRGLIVARNDLMDQATGKYFLSLDDDAYLTRKDDLERAFKYLELHPQVAVLAFKLVCPGESVSEASPSLAYPVFLFPGGAHLIRFGILNKIGNYREFFFHQGEESDLCFRIWNAGYQVMAFPSVQVVHDYTLQARNWERMHFYGPRNALLNIWLHLPLALLGPATVNFITKNLIHHFRQRTLKHSLRGMQQAVRDLPMVLRHRQPVEWSTMLQIMRLPRQIF